MDRIKLPRQVLLLGSAVLLLLFVFIFDWFNNPRKKNDFRVSSDSEIVKVILSPIGSEPIKLECRNNGSWTLNHEHGVNEISLRDLFQTLNLLTTRQPVSRSNVDQVNQNLDAEGITVTVVEKKSLVNLFNSIILFPIHRKALKFEIGRAAFQGSGAYARKVGSEEPYLIHVPGSEVPLSSFFSPELTYWFDPVIVDLKAGDIEKVEIQSLLPEKESLKIEIRNETWEVIANQQRVDPTRISSFSLDKFLNSFKELYFERLLMGQDSLQFAERMVRPKFKQIIVGAKSGKITTIDFYYMETVEGKTNPDLFFVVVNNKKLATARFFVFNRIMKPNSYFLR